MNNNTFISAISGKEFDKKEKINGSILRKSLFEFIKKEHPDFNNSSSISISELNFYRQKFISQQLVNDVGELNDLKKEVITAIKTSELISNHQVTKNNSDDSFGNRIVDKVANFGGSWTFIILFVLILILWISINLYVFNNKGFDPYPFILLNLILSCVAALQAPVIMMSQNRQEAKDRERAKNDYMVNLKAELEIRLLHEKIDHLIMHQQQELLEIQEIQTDMIKEILTKINQK